MGVSIHYKGQLDNKTSVHQLIEEIQDIAETMNWTYHCLDEDWNKKSQVKLEHHDGQTHIKGHAGLKGISFCPHPESETVWLFFDADGCLNSPINMVMKDNFEDASILSWLSTKTQFAGTDTHIAIIKLFRYLKKKYISNLEIEDEGGYWYSNNRTQLEEKINGINIAIDMLTDAFTNLPLSSDDDAESMVRKIENLLKDLGFENASD